MNHNLPPVTQNPMEAARNALAAESTIAVQWEVSNTTTALIREPGATIPADVFRNQTVIITDATGAQHATDFSVGVTLPKYDMNTGLFGVGATDTPKVTGYDYRKDPGVAEDIVLGEPLWGVGPRVAQVTLSSEAMLSMDWAPQEVIDHFQHPDQKRPLPDPTFDAVDFLDRTRKHYNLPH